MKRRILAAALCSLGAAQSVLAEATDNLLDLAVLQADASAIAATPADIFEALTDGDASTIAPFTSLDGAPVDLLFQFDAQTISPDSVEWALADGSGSPAPGRIDVMVSNIAPTEGFVSLRLGPIDPLRAKQRMGFQPRAANWVRIRLYPPANSQTFALGDLHLKGALGPPQTRYAFGETPADAIDVISALAGIGSADLQLTEAEAAIFKRAGDNELDSKDFTAIALLASGVVDPQARNAYEQQIEALAERARAKDDPNAPLSQRGSALLDFLHSAALTDGYREGQTDLSTLLDSGVFNCVSSAVLYNAIALRLGMDARAIEVPDHAFSIVYDGLDHMDVETTTPEGFNPARDRVAAFEQLTGFRYIPQSNTAKRREIGTNGLAALIYYNHGVTHLAEGRYQEALFANFRALSLDPDFASAGTNALAALGQWSAALAENGAWEDSTKIAAVAVRLAPDDRGLASNQIAVWQQWATSEVNAGHPAKALEILRAAGTSVDMETFAGIEIAILTRPAETLIAAGDWEAALTQAETLDALMDAQGRNGLESWRKSVFGRWASATIDQGAYAAPLAVLARALADFPDDPRLERAVRYLGQEWAIAEGYETGLAVLTQIETALPNIDQMDDVVLAHVHRHISTGLTTTPLDQMLAQVTLADALVTADQSDDLAARVYMAYGAAKIDASQWQDAAAIYAAAVTRFPAHNGLGRNTRYVAQEWQRDAGKGDDLAALEAVQNELRALFPAFAVDPEFGEDEIIRQINTLLRDRAFDEAQQKLASAQLLLRPESYRDLQELIFDQIAQAAMADSNWENAAMTYAEGQLALGDRQIFSRNIRYITQEWTKSSAASGGVAAVAETMDRMTTLFPHDAKIPDIGLRTLEQMIAEQVNVGAFAQAQAIVRRSASFLTPQAAGELVVRLYTQQASMAIEAQDWEAALRAYADGLAIQPDTRDLQRNVPYVVQEWSRSALATGGAQLLTIDLETMRDILGEADTINDVIKNVLAIEVETHVAQGSPELAFEILNTTAPSISDEVVEDLKEHAYGLWARKHLDAKEWDEAIRIYDMGLTELSDSSLLSNNRRYAEAQK